MRLNLKTAFFCCISVLCLRDAEAIEPAGHPEMARMHDCIRGLKTALIPFADRRLYENDKRNFDAQNQAILLAIQSGQEIPEKTSLSYWEYKQLDSRADFFPAKSNDRPGFIGIRGGKSYFFSLPAAPTLTAKGKPKYYLQLRIEPRSSLVGDTRFHILNPDSIKDRRNRKRLEKYREVVTKAYTYSGIAYVYFERNENGEIIQETLNIHSDPNQKGDLDRLLDGKDPNERTKLANKRDPRVDISVFAELNMAPETVDSIASHIQELMLAEKKPYYRDFLRGHEEDRKSFLSLDREDIVTIVPTHNVYFRLERDFVLMKRKPSALFLQDTEKLFQSALNHTNACQEVEHPKVRAAYDELFEKMQSFATKNGLARLFREPASLRKKAKESKKQKS